MIISCAIFGAAIITMIYGTSQLSDPPYSRLSPEETALKIRQGWITLLVGTMLLFGAFGSCVDEKPLTRSNPIEVEQQP